MRVLKNLFGDNSKINASEVIVAPGLLLSDAVIVEKGENFNGSWIKFGDGTIICRHTMTVPGTKIKDFNAIAFGRWK